MEQEGNFDVLPMFEEAVRIVLEVRQHKKASFSSICSLVHTHINKTGLTQRQGNLIILAEVKNSIANLNLDDSVVDALCGVFQHFWGVMSCILFVFSAVFRITQRPGLSEFQYQC